MTGDGGATDSGQRLFPGRIDVENKDLVRTLERRGEFPREGLCPRIQVGLKDHDAASPGDGRVAGWILLGDRAQSRQRGPDLSRVMGVVVKDPHPGGAAHQFETSAHTLKPRQSVEDRVNGCTRLESGQHCAECVERHVPAGDRKPHGPHLSRTGRTGQADVGDRADAVLFPADQRRGEVLTGSAAVAQNPDTECGTAVAQGGRAGIVGADHQRSPGPHAFDECVEYRGVGLGAAEKIEMIGFHIGHHRDIGGVLQQRAVALVGLGHEHLATAMVGIGAGLAQIAADGKRGIKPAMLQGDDEHRRGRGLAVGSGHHQRAVAGHQLRQHGGSHEHRNPATVGFHQFRISLGNGGVRGDYRRHAAGQAIQVGHVVADADLSAADPQCHQPTRFLGVRTRHQPSAIEQDAGDSGHARSADPHHVNPFKLGRQRVHRRTPGPARATARTISATRRAASRWPTPAAADVIAASRAESVNNRTTSVPT